MASAHATRRWAQLDSFVYCFSFTADGNKRRLSIWLRLDARRNIAIARPPVCNCNASQLHTIGRELGIDFAAVKSGRLRLCFSAHRSSLRKIDDRLFCGAPARCDSFACGRTSRALQAGAEFELPANRNCTPRGVCTAQLRTCTIASALSKPR